MEDLLGPVEFVAPSTLREHADNEPLFGKFKTESYFASLKEDILRVGGFTSPLLICPDGLILEGHSRLRIAQELLTQGFQGADDFPQLIPVRRFLRPVSSEEQRHRLILGNLLDFHGRIDHNSRLYLVGLAFPELAEVERPGRKPKEDPTPSALLVTRDNVADLFGVSPRQVDRDRRVLRHALEMAHSEHRALEEADIQTARAQTNTARAVSIAPSVPSAFSWRDRALMVGILEVLRLSEDLPAETLPEVQGAILTALARLPITALGTVPKALRSPMKKASSPELEITPEYAKVFELVRAKRNLFVTGKAGTGKSTLLRLLLAKLQSSEFRKLSASGPLGVAVVAPTGLAAMNVGGSTIHSFFRISPGSTLEETEKALQAYQAPLPKDSKKLALVESLKALDVLVIDEVSMVRADLLDQVSLILRSIRAADQKNAVNNTRCPARCRDLPFGGVQIILFGDPHQLPPVVKEEERPLFETRYQSEFFFDSFEYAQASVTALELTKVFRQTDAAFVEVLNAIRQGQATKNDLEPLNVRATFSPPLETPCLVLTPTTDKARGINAQKMAALSGRSQSFRATVKLTAAGIAQGWTVERILETYARDFPAEPVIELKERAQVMILKNSPPFKNGSLTKILSLDPLRVHSPEGSITLTPGEWEISRYEFDPEKKALSRTVLAVYEQIPVQLAWGITIHKSQGQTLEQVEVDFGRGTFASGQAYVALSRCRTLEGLYLSRPVEPEHILIHPRILKFSLRLQSNRSECSGSV